MTSDRIKEIQEQTAYPDSRSVQLALNQVWNECEQQKLTEQRDARRVAINEGRVIKTERIKSSNIELLNTH